MHTYKSPFNVRLSPPRAVPDQIKPMSSLAVAVAVAVVLVFPGPILALWVVWGRRGLYQKKKRKKNEKKR